MRELKVLILVESESKKQFTKSIQRRVWQMAFFVKKICHKRNLPMISRTLSFANLNELTSILVATDDIDVSITLFRPHPNGPKGVIYNALYDDSRTNYIFNLAASNFLSHDSLSVLAEGFHKYLDLREQNVIDPIEDDEEQLFLTRPFGRRTYKKWCDEYRCEN